MSVNDLQTGMQGMTMSNSTPGRNSTARKSQADNHKYQKDQVFDEIALDLKKTQKCGIDPILKYFIYLVLKKDSQEKEELDQLADDLESIRLQRRQLEQEGRGAKGDNASILEKRERDLKDLEETEATLVKSRNDIQDKLLYNLLSAVLGIANDREQKTLLSKLEKSRRKKNEKARYPPLVNLCNAVLTKLQSLGVEPFKSSNEELNIRFQVNDPSHIQFQYHGTAEAVDRCPDFIASSYNALVRYSKTTSPRYDAKPPTALEWPIVLLSREVKTKVHVTLKDFKSRGELKDITNHTFTIELKPAHEEEHENLEDLDPSDDEGMNPGEEDDEGGNDEEVNPLDVPDARHSRVTSLKRSRDVEQLGSDQDQPQAKKNRPLPTPPFSNSGSHSFASQPTEELHVQGFGKEAVAGRVQCASYALEMLSYSVGVRHAINLLLTDRILWVWYYDRQGIIQSTGISIFKDFPRFIALLFLFQRFSLEDWGIIPALNPEAVNGHGMSNVNTSASTSGKKQNTKEEPHAIPLSLRLRSEDGPCLENYKDFSTFWKERGDTSAFELTEVEIPDVKDFLSQHPHCLAGRATAVVPAVGYGADRASKVDIVCKISHPEVQRRHEGTTMAIIYKIATEDQSRPETKAKKAETGYDWNIFNHLPKFYFHGDVKGTSTHLIRTLVDCDTSGCRTMRIIGMKKLNKVTTRQSWNFMKAWLEGVICHAFLWQNFVEHGDPSINNLMCNPDTGCGVLTDFDLSLLQWEPRVLGTERTGTVPFMALDLLTDAYWEHGVLIRQYRHELESFIWMLPYVFLQYAKGEKRPDSLINDWRTGDYKVCEEKKTRFLHNVPASLLPQVQKDFRRFWRLACMALDALRNATIRRNERAAASVWAVDPADDDFLGPSGQGPPIAIAAASAEHAKSDSDDLWDRFVKQMADAFQLDQLKEFSPESLPLLAWLGFYKPSFEPLSDSQADALRKKYSSDKL